MDKKMVVVMFRFEDKRPETDRKDSDLDVYGYEVIKKAFSTGVFEGIECKVEVCDVAS